MQTGLRTSLLIGGLAATSLTYAAGGPPPDVQGNPDSALFLLIFYVLLALVVSFLCSVAEAVLLSITPTYIETLKTDNPKLAARLKQLKLDNVDQSLAAILTLNTIAHTMGSIGAGAQSTIVFGSAWFGVFSAVMTLLVLVLSEIIPKTLGAVFWQKLTKPTVWYVNTLVKLLYPLVWFSERLTRLIARGHSPHGVSRDEFLAMARAGEAAGQLGDNESRIINNLLHLDSLKVTDVMTPVTVIAALPETTTVEEAMVAFSQRPFSRWPIYSSDINNISGFALKTDVFLSQVEQHSGTPLSQLKREIQRIPASISVSNLLENFLREKQHIAIVIDEHGATRGLVTLEDLIETLIGVEIMDEVDTVADMRQLARKLWQDRANALGIDVPVEKQ